MRSLVPGAMLHTYKHYKSIGCHSLLTAPQKSPWEDVAKLKGFHLNTLRLTKAAINHM